MRSIAAVVIVLILHPGPLAWAQDACRADLLVALKSTVSDTSINSLSAGSRQWFCSSDFEQRVRSNESSVNVTVPIKGVPVKFGAGANNTDALERRREFCSDASSRFDEYHASQIARQIVDPAAVAVYEACVGRPATSIGLSHVLNEAAIVVTARFTPLTDGQPPPIIEGLSVTGATGGGGYFAPGKEVNVAGITDVFQRKGSDAVTITLHTTAGARTLSLPRDRRGLEAGSVVVQSVFETEVAVNAGTVFQDRTTGDHHCSRNCQGEPTRTHYTIELKVSPPEIIQDPKLECLGGPCAWSGAAGASLTGNHSALGYFDVWSRPTTWRLSATKYRMEKRYRTDRSQPQKVRYGGTFVVRAPKSAVSTSVTLSGPDGDYTFNPASFIDGQVLQLMGTSMGADEVTYTFLVKPQ